MDVGDQPHDRWCGQLLEEYVKAFFVALQFRGISIGSALTQTSEVRGGCHLEAAAFNARALRFTRAGDGPKLGPSVKIATEHFCRRLR